MFDRLYVIMDGVLYAKGSLNIYRHTIPPKSIIECFPRFLNLLIAKCSVSMLAMLHETSGLTVSCTQNATSRWHCIDPLCIHTCICIYCQIPLLYAGLYAQKI